MEVTSTFTTRKYNPIEEGGEHNGVERETETEQNNN